MLRNNNTPKDGGALGKFPRWPFDEFQKSWVVMGGDMDKFGSACMLDFQLLRSAWCIKNGINEDAEIDRLETVEDLDNLYASF